MSLLKLIGNNINEKVEITFKGKTEKVEVKPLNITDIAVLLERHTNEMSDLLTGTGDIFKGLAEKAPDFAAGFIGLGIVETIDKAEIKKLPFSIQLRLCEEIWKLSVVDAEYLGKLVGRIAAGLGKAAQKTGTSISPEKEIKEELEKHRKALENSGK